MAANGGDEGEPRWAAHLCWRSSECRTSVGLDVHRTNLAFSTGCIDFPSLAVNTRSIRTGSTRSTYLESMDRDIEEEDVLDREFREFDSQRKAIAWMNQQLCNIQALRQRRETLPRPRRTWRRSVVLLELSNLCGFVRCEHAR